jgi:hypothetical protein
MNDLCRFQTQNPLFFVAMAKSNKRKREESSEEDSEESSYTVEVITHARVRDAINTNDDAWVSAT